MSRARPRQAGPADAKQAGLVYVSDVEPGLSRRRAGKGFSYSDDEGRTVRDAATLARIRKLAIPPAWTEVWICRDARGHLQATGRDARSRKQYLYHPDFRAQREATKYDGIADFARRLPAIRERLAADMAKPGLPREKVLATVVHLLETTLIRIGNLDYARQNDSYGITTLQDEHVAVRHGGSELRFRFTGKSGRSWHLRLRDRRVTRIVKACQDLPGQHLFQYLDDAGEQHSVTSSDVNDYLREIAGDAITAKDFRTWGGTMLAAMALQAFPAPDTKMAAKRNLRAAIDLVGGRLGNTPAICRKCYIHPVVINAYERGTHRLRILASNGSALRPEEAAVLDLLEDGKDGFSRRGRAAPSRRRTSARR